MKLAILNARIIDTSQNLDEIGNLYVEDGRILALGKSPKNWQADKTIEANNLILTPGFIDIGTNLGKSANITSEINAAYKGGYTTLAISPLTSSILDNTANIETLLDKSRNLIDLIPIAAISKNLEGQLLTNMGALKSIGCVGVTNLRRKYVDLNVMSLALQYAKGMNLKVFFYSQDSELTAGGVAHKGSMATNLGLATIPTSAEIVSLSRDLILTQEHKLDAHFGGLSSAAAIDILQYGRKLNMQFSTDVNIANLLYTDEALADYDTNFHVEPPLRGKHDREKLLQAVNAGFIDVITTGHMPVPIAEKNAPFAESVAGMSTLEVAFSMAYKLVLTKELDFTRLISALTAAPAKVLNLTDRGNLKIGSYADFNLIDLNTSWQPTLNNWQSTGINNPCIDTQLPATIKACFVKGELKYSAM